MAFVHGVRVATENLTPWKGGGFGMFSTVDSGASRILTVELASDGVTYTASFPSDESIRELASLTKRLPSASNLGQLANELAAGVWCLDPRDSGSADARVARSADIPVRHPLYTMDPALIREGRYKRRLYRADLIENARPTQICPVETCTVRVERIVYERTSRQLTMEAVAEAHATGLDVDSIARELNVSPAFVSESLLFRSRDRVPR